MARALLAAVFAVVMTLLALVPVDGDPAPGRRPTPCPTP